jgi:Amino-transferase class IV
MLCSLVQESLRRVRVAESHAIVRRSFATVMSVQEESIVESFASLLQAQTQPQPRLAMEEKIVKPHYAWCCTAYMEDNCGSLQRVTGYDDSQCSLHYLQKDDSSNDGGSATGTTGKVSKDLDMTVIADWMHHTYMQHQETELPGVYDSLRCDYVWHTTPGQSPWNIWGEAFHIERLQKSFRYLVDNNPTLTTTRCLERAAMESKLLFRALLQEAATHPMFLHHEHHRHDHDTDHLNNSKGHQFETSEWSWPTLAVQVVRFTWMWSPTRDYDHITVRAHACSTTEPIKVSLDHLTPIDVNIALPQKNVSTPSRWDHDAHIKVARWTRERKEIAQPEGIGEVLLVKQHGTRDYQLLEGLSSNLFVLYKDGSLRTADQGVLQGYVRKLVLDSAECLHIPVSSEPILLSEVDQWKEAFITSSSRLLYPIRRINVPNQDGSMREIWNDESFDSATDAVPALHKPVWQQLLDSIWHCSGYAKLC